VDDGIASKGMGTRMAKLYFYYSSMNAGKSTVLLQSSYNYRERGMNTLVFTPEIDTRHGQGQVASRIGLAAPALAFSPVDDLFEMTRRAHAENPVHCVLVDEAQFLSKRQVRQLSDVADRLDIPVLTYGLRTDFQGNLFEGSMHLLAWADNLSEIKTICHCGRKATMVLRLDDRGNPVHDGDQVKIGGNERYVSVCRKHFKEGLATRTSQPLLFDARNAEAQEDANRAGETGEQP
jgi:thymidine kinase